MKKNILTLFLFIGLTVVMNYPRSVHLTNTIDDKGDSLLNTWILAWNVHKLTTGMDDYFDGNIFHPHKNVLAYSEYLFASSLLALPVMVISKNPILGYNFVWFLSFVLSGWGTYLLVNYLLRDRLAGIVAGITFAFFPFRYDHLSHLQMLTAQWIPFTFLYLHKFFRNTSYKNILLFTLFYILTVLSCGYYALFITFFIGLYMTAALFINYRKLCFDYQLWSKLSLFVLIVVVTTGPFFYQYHVVKNDMGFTRPLSEAKYFSADITSYLYTSHLNRIYGKINRIFGKPEGALFPGITPIILSVLGLWGCFSIYSPKNRVAASMTASKPSSFYTVPLKLLNLGIIVYILVVSIIIFSGGFFIDIKNHHKDVVLMIKAGHLEKPVLILTTLIIIRCIISKKIMVAVKNIFIDILFRIPKIQGYYLGMLILAFLFTLGPVIHFFGKSIIDGPYMLLYYLVPGFDGLRVPSRFVIMVVLALCVLSGYGFKKIVKRFSNGKIRIAICFFLSFLLLLEFFSAPLRLTYIKTGNDIPQVYKWLSTIKGDVVVMELPMKDVWTDVPYMYYSTYHWKKLVNGFSGYYPPVYLIVRDLVKNFPSPASIKAIREINTDYVILHSSDYKKKSWKQLENRIKGFGNDLKLVQRFDADYVYELINKDDVIEKPENNKFQKISSDKWVAYSNQNEEDVDFAFDGNLNTRWTTNKPQTAGAFFTLDLGSYYNIQKIIISLKKHISDYPRDYQIQVSNDGIAWEDMGGETDAHISISSALRNPKIPDFELRIPPVTCRFLKITLTSRHDTFYWSINELNVFGEIVQP